MRALGEEAAPVALSRSMMPSQVAIAAKASCFSTAVFTRFLTEKSACEEKLESLLQQDPCDVSLPGISLGCVLEKFKGLSSLFGLFCEAC